MEKKVWVSVIGPKIIKSSFASIKNSTLSYDELIRHAIKWLSDEASSKILKDPRLKEKALKILSSANLSQTDKIFVTKELKDELVKRRSDENGTWFGFKIEDLIAYTIYFKGNEKLLIEANKNPNQDGEFNRWGGWVTSEKESENEVKNPDEGMPTKPTNDSQAGNKSLVTDDGLARFKKRRLF